MNQALYVAIEWVLKIETGRITDHPKDPGGLTRWGISKRAYPDLDIAALTREQAAEIYRRDYWGPCHAGDIAARAPRLAVALFDAAVNQGVGTAIKTLQKALGASVDGQWGPATAGAAQRADDRLLPEFLGYRALRYADGQADFRRGWFNRLFELQQHLFENLKSI